MSVAEVVSMAMAELLVVMLLKSMVTMLIKGHHVEVGVGVLPSREGRRCYSGL